MTKKPDWQLEQEHWQNGLEAVAGADEVGRGAFAGPVVAAFVVFPRDVMVRYKKTRIVINDSKKLTRKQREEANDWIKENALAWGIGEAEVSMINKHGIVNALHTSYRRAANNLYHQVKVDRLLIDAFPIPRLKGIPKKLQIPIVKGDTISFSIAAASVIAKVYRDGKMTALSSEIKYRIYNWHKNMGYGTKEHRQAILANGVSKLHRIQYVNSFLRNKKI